MTAREERSDCADSGKSKPQISTGAYPDFLPEAQRSSFNFLTVALVSRPGGEAE
jgi:hypothetical protein